MFHVKKYSEILGKMADDKKVQRMHKHDLVKVMDHLGVQP
jgi:hypothetical protein